MREYGDVNKSLEGQYKFDIRSLFEQGWQQTQGNKWILLQCLLAIAGGAFLVVFIAFTLLDVRSFNQLDLTTRTSLDVLLTVLLAPFFAAILLMAISSSIGQKIMVKQLFDTLPQAALLGLTALLSAFLVQLGMLLFVLPGVYLAIATGFALPLVVDKKMMPSKALLLSVRVVNCYWLSFIKLYGLFVLLFLFSLFTLGIALIWVAPLYYNIKGLLYRDLFGVNIDVPQTDIIESKDDVFHA